MIIYALNVLLCLLCSCQAGSDDSIKSGFWQEIKGRDTNGDRTEIYRVRVPPHWIRRDPLPEESVSDTTKALCEFLIREDKQIIRIAIHNFPSDNLEERIPPEAQVARWKRQFESLDPNTSSVAPQSFSGFEGLLFSGSGLLKEEETMMLGWSLQLAPEHYRNLQHPSTDKESLYRQMRGDVTIKAVGPKAFMEKHQNAIVAFARSFELIGEIPSRS